MARQVDTPYFARCEPPLADLLSDPILQMLMAKDRVLSQDLQALIDGVRSLAIVSSWDDANAEDFRGSSTNSSPRRAPVTS